MAAPLIRPSGTFSPTAEFVELVGIDCGGEGLRGGRVPGLPRSPSGHRVRRRTGVSAGRLGETEHGVSAADRTLWTGADRFSGELADRAVAGCWFELHRQGGCGAGELSLKDGFPERDEVQVGDWIACDGTKGIAGTWVGLKNVPREVPKWCAAAAGNGSRTGGGVSRRLRAGSGGWDAAALVRADGRVVSTGTRTFPSNLWMSCKTPHRWWGCCSIVTSCRRRT